MTPPSAYLTPVSFPLEAEAICDKCGEVFTAGYEVKEPGGGDGGLPRGLLPVRAVRGGSVKCLSISHIQMGNTASASTETVTMQAIETPLGLQVNGKRQKRQSTSLSTSWIFGCR